MGSKLLYKFDNSSSKLIKSFLHQKDSDFLINMVFLSLNELHGRIQGTPKQKPID